MRGEPCTTSAKGWSDSGRKLVQELGVPLAGIAWQMGVSTSAISQIFRRRKKTSVRDGTLLLLLHWAKGIMPRHAIIDSSGTFRHVLIRGIEGRNIFLEIDDSKRGATGTILKLFSNVPHHGFDLRKGGKRWARMPM
jgi:hypothetical protein